MFYSHEILTSREGGLATVWLVATLGSKSNLKKVNRKAILDVNVPKTCEIIIRPEAPMALRLQSNLLYGVSRVYSQQYGYVLSDAQVAQSNMRALLKAVRTSELDPDAGKARYVERECSRVTVLTVARPEQIMIQDDPAFLPDLVLPGLDIDRPALDTSADVTSRWSSISSPHSQRPSLSGQQDSDGSMVGLIIPTSDSGGAGNLGGFQLPSEDISSAQRNERPGRLLEYEGAAFDVDPGFSIDAEGNLIEEPIGGSEVRRAPVRTRSDSVTSARVRQELQEGLQQGQYDPGAMNVDFDMPRFVNEGAILPDAEPFPTLAAGYRTNIDQIRSSPQAHEDRESSESAEAPLRRRGPKPRVLPVDERQELRNAELASWKEDYLTNMVEATQTRQHHQAPFAAKKNAAFFVMGAGVGGVGTGIGSSKINSPLEMFAGDTMMGMLTGIRLTAGKKRGRGAEDGEDSDSEERRIRLREADGEQVGRGDEIMLPDDDTMMIRGSDGIEIGRHAAPSLADDPMYPWNTTVSALASRQGSSIARGHAGGLTSSVGGFPTSAAGPSPFPGIGVGSHDRRGSRIMSASPLIGRGQQRYSSLEIPIGDDDELLGAPPPVSDDAHQGFNDDYDSFQVHGPAAGVSTQTAAQSQWIKATLDREAQNFLAFVKAEINALPLSAAQRVWDVVDDEDELLSPAEHLAKPTVLFGDLLPPGQHSAIVAAQALHHVLALATKRLVDVKQDEPFRGIHLSLPFDV
ncbi:MAG: hypothetical protein Q9217_004867 [Psora testacea]